MTHQGLTRRQMLAALFLAASSPRLALAADGIRTDALILMDVASAGDALVAVGEQGTVLHSTDGGATWDKVPTGTTQTLTATVFSTAAQGIAVGHGGVLLRSEDGGKSWRKPDVPRLDQASFLAAAVITPQRLVAFGAFGLFMKSEDAGRSWIKLEILTPDFDRHLYGLCPLSADHWLLVGESGTLLSTSDAGGSWQALSSPYDGSFFGALQAKDGAALLFGMRGKVFRSINGETDWNEITTGVQSAFNGGRVMADGRIVLLGNSGTVAISRDDGKMFQTRTLDRAADFAAIAQAPSSLPVLVGSTGITHPAQSVGLL